VTVCAQIYADSIKDDKLVKLMQECWDTDPDQRPSFSEINSRLDDMLVTPDSASEPKPMSSFLLGV